MSRSPDEGQPSSSLSRPGSDTPAKPEKLAGPVYIIDDSSADVGLIRKTLALHEIGLPAVTISNGAEAVLLLEKLDKEIGECPALVILDLNLPKVPGLDVLKRIRASPVCGTVPVVVFSSSAAAKDKEAAARLGADSYVTKPSTFDEFMAFGEILKSFLRSPPS